MKHLFRSLTGPYWSVTRVLGRRYFASSTEQYARRNYADNVAEYKTVIESLSAQKRNFLLRDVYDDMMLDGVRPARDLFHALIGASMKGASLEDGFYFKDQMTVMGFLPDVSLYNILISLCGKCGHSDRAIQILEEMKISEVKPNAQTFGCLLNTCAATGQLDRVYAIARDMTAVGVGLNKFSYAGLITAHKNKRPKADDFATKVIEFVKRSKELLEAGTTSVTAENLMMGISEEEFYNLPTAEYVHWRSGDLLNRQLTVYHAALHACAELRNVEVMATLLEMLKNDGITRDVFIVMQTMRCYLNSGDIDRGLQTFEDYMNSGMPIPIELRLALVEGAMVGYTPKGMQVAQVTLEEMNSRGFFLSRKLGSDLLLIASGEKTGGYTVANYIWDLMQAHKVVPIRPALEAYYKGLRERRIPEDDPRLLLVSQIRQRGASTS